MIFWIKIKQQYEVFSMEIEILSHTGDTFIEILYEIRYENTLYNTLQHFTTRL